MKGETTYDIWACQFLEKRTCMVSPIMVRDKMLQSREADITFKLNFLVMIYNFFIEGHQNRHVMSDIVSFSGVLIIVETTNGVAY